MRRITRATMLAAVCVAALLAAGGARAQNYIDTTRLPRAEGTRDVFVNPASTIFVTPGTVAEAAEIYRKMLIDAGWQQYNRPFSSNPVDLPSRILEFKKGTQALSVHIVKAPAQGGATSVSYTAVLLETDLPFTADATDIEFSADRPYLKLVTAESVEATLAFYRKEMAALGWSLWSAEQNAKQDGGADGAIYEVGAHAFYVQDGKKPLVLILRRADDGRLKVEIKAVTNEFLAAQSKRSQTPTAAAATRAPGGVAPGGAAAPAVAAPAPTATTPTAPPQTSRDTQAGGRVAVAPEVPVRAATTPAVAAEAPVRGPSIQIGPMPLPTNVSNIAYDSGEGRLAFDSTLSVAALASFYRDQLKPQGWREEPSVINRPNMVVLDFLRGDRKVSFTIMQMGPRVNVSARGNGLANDPPREPKPPARTAQRDTAPAPPPVVAPVQATPAPTPAPTPAAAPADVSSEDLEAEESGGLPVPKRHISTTGTNSGFRNELHAEVPLDLDTVFGFYLRELIKRGWKKESQGAVFAPDQVAVAFTTPDGPAQLRLDRKDGKTIVSLSLRKTAAAEKAGMLPKAGQVKLLLGNMTNEEAVITVDKQTIKVAAGAGRNSPDGPKIDLPPGKYKVTIKLASRGVHTQDVEVGADETWGLLVGPGGVMPLHLY